MNTNENIDAITAENVIVLGIASADTMGGPLVGEEIGGTNAPGISAE